MNREKLKYRCLVLDHDDTVMDSTRLIHHPAFLEFLREVRPGTSISLEAYFRMNFHPGFLEYCEETMRLTPAELDRELAVWKGYVATHVPPAFPGMKALMEEQLKRGGHIAVISHSLRENILRDYRENGLPEPSMVFGWDLPREQRKPSPFALDRLMACMDLAPKDMLMVDDLKPGYDMARTRGVPFAAAGWAYDVPEIRAYLQRNCPLYFDRVEGLYRYLFEE
ncbi:MAG: HAD hydrolase-like protein [Clostridia bacterium]|nr:HAD hydrolase-like protein [Clostridia bacterium]